VPHRLHGRYELLQCLSERREVERFHGLDHGSPLEGPVAVVVVRAPILAGPPALPIAEVVPPGNVTSTNPDIPLAIPVAAEPASPLGILQEKELLAQSVFPGREAGGPLSPAASILLEPLREATLRWERTLLETVGHPLLPAVLDYFIEDGFEYLVEEIPSGRILWDAWDDPEATAEQRFNWLKHVVEQMQALHRGGAMLESLRPDMIVVTTKDQGRLADLSELLPLPLHAGLPIRGSLYTAPELVADPGRADIRASLYSIGALLYALHIGRELTEMDFIRPGYPKPFVPQFPDIHPAFGRLMMKTFCREPAHRFPSDEAAREDPSGLTELLRTLETCRRTFDNVHLELAAWTTTGMVRSGNEDAFALLHAGESRQDDSGERALVLLADGMGGYEAGEVAAALTIESLRKELLQHEPFAVLAGRSPLAPGSPQEEGGTPPVLDVEQAKKTISAALQLANQHVVAAARNGLGRRGMGCTAEVVYLDGRNVVVGHVGDSRVYHLQEGRLRQLTRDHTLVNRLVEIGSLTPEEAENHPRRNELQQAIGGQPDVEPSMYHARLKAGDWVVVCSDGLSNHVHNRDLRQMLESEALSADMAARRLVNLANIEGATDNASVVVVRAT
jgi:serine/threonine protein phosphatase PrpC